MLKLFQELGGRRRLESEVSEILTRGNRVVIIATKTGETHECDLVASNADVVHTYDRLLRREPKIQRTRKRLAAMSYSMSLFLIYFGTRRQYSNLQHHNIIFGPRYRELLKDIFRRGRLAEDFSLYLHAPTRSDPSLAPPGCEAFYVLSPVPHLGKLSVDWSLEGPRYAERILEYLERHYIPNLRNEIVTQRIFTPQDFRSELNAHFGSAFSLEPRLMQSAYFRVQNRDPNLIGLYLVGAGTHPGAGIPGVVNSAKATAGLILDDIRKSVVVRSSNQVQRLSYA
jgi:phytoene desaturase